MNLVYGFVTLQDNFDIGGFSVKRQAALNALVACCPRKVAPYVLCAYSTDTLLTWMIMRTLQSYYRGVLQKPVLDGPALCYVERLSSRCS